LGAFKLPSSNKFETGEKIEMMLFSSSVFLYYQFCLFKFGCGFSPLQKLFVEGVILPIQALGTEALSISSINSFILRDMLGVKWSIFGRSLGKHTFFENVKFMAQSEDILNAIFSKDK
jgi:hypothetical protein